METLSEYISHMQHVMMQAVRTCVKRDMFPLSPSPWLLRFLVQAILSDTQCSLQVHWFGESTQMVGGQTDGVAMLVPPHGLVWQEKSKKTKGNVMTE